jgi:head-tail adaptor
VGLAAGELDRDIVLQIGTDTQSASGEPIRSWANVTAETLDNNGTIAAQWLPAGTKEAWQAQQRLGSYVDGVFRIYDRTVRPVPDASRILFDNRIFDVRPYVEIERGVSLDIPVVARGE